MRRSILMLLICLMFAVSAFAEYPIYDNPDLGKVVFYGNARIRAFYQYTDEDFNLTSSGVSQARMFFEEAIQKNSRLGLRLSGKDWKGLSELAVSGAGVSLRHLYGEYSVDDVAILIGQTETGFNELTNQVYRDDLGAIGYGAAWGGRVAQIRITWQDAYIILMQPNAIPADSSKVSDLLLPKLNIGLKYKLDDVVIHPTVGLNISSLNPDFSASGKDETLVAAVAAFTATWNTDEYGIKTHVFGGTNVGDYGLTTATASFCETNTVTGEIEDTATFGGYAEVRGNVDETITLVGGAGYVSSDNDLRANADDAMTAWVQCKFRITPLLDIVPEVGVVDEMKDPLGNQTGSTIYFGAKFQANF